MCHLSVKCCRADVFVVGSPCYRSLLLFLRSFQARDYFHRSSIDLRSVKHPQALPDKQFLISERAFDGDFREASRRDSVIILEIVQNSAESVILPFVPFISLFLYFSGEMSRTYRTRLNFRNGHTIGS